MPKPHQPLFAFVVLVGYPICRISIRSRCGMRNDWSTKFIKCSGTGPGPYQGVLIWIFIEGTIRAFKVRLGISVNIPYEWQSYTNCELQERFLNWFGRHRDVIALFCRILTLCEDIWICWVNCTTPEDNWRWVGISFTAPHGTGIWTSYGRRQSATSTSRMKMAWPPRTGPRITALSTPSGW